MKKVALVLGGGGAKSFTQLGVIKVLQDHNIPIDLMVTCSGGSLIGALIAQGNTIKQIRTEFYKRIHRLQWLRLSLSKRGLASQKIISRIIEKLSKNMELSKTKIKLMQATTNFRTGKLKVFEEGDIRLTTSASLAFPGIYKPVKIGDDYFIDGGILNSIPADIARQEIGKDNVVISVSLDNCIENDNADNLNLVQIMYRSVYIPLIETRERIINENSDLVIEPFKKFELNFTAWKDVLKYTSIKKMTYFYELGISETEKRIEDIKKLVFDEN